MNPLFCCAELVFLAVHGNRLAGNKLAMVELPPECRLQERASSKLFLVGSQMSKMTLENVRSAVRREFAEFGWKNQLIEEAILLHESNYYGHRFTFKRWCAVWQLDSETIEVFVESQQIKSVSIGKTSSDAKTDLKHPQNRAA